MNLGCFVFFPNRCINKILLSGREAKVSLKWDASALIYGGTKSPIKIACCLSLTVFHSLKILHQQRSIVCIRNILTPSTSAGNHLGVQPCTTNPRNTTRPPPTFACAVLSSKFLKRPHDSTRDVGHWSKGWFQTPRVFPAPPENFPAPPATWMISEFR